MPSITYAPCSECRKLNRIPTESGERKPVCGSCKSELPIQQGVNEVSASELLLLVEKSPLPVLTDFWAPWCGPCKAFAPVFLQASREFAGQVVFAKVNTQDHPLASDTYGIRGIPTLILFRDGFERSRKSGALPFSMLAEWVRAHTGSSKAA